MKQRMIFDDFSYDLSNILTRARLVQTQHLTEYPSAKTGDIRGYHPSDIPQFSNRTSSTINHRFNFKSRRESVLWLLQKEGYIFLFINISSRALQNIWRIINTIASILHENMLVYLSLDITCSSKLTVSLDLCSQKTVRILDQKMSVHIFTPYRGIETCWIL